MVRMCVLLVCGFAAVAPVSPRAASPVYTLYPIEVLAARADTILIGTVSSLSEKMENKSLDGVVSPFLVLTVRFQNVEVLRGDPEKAALRQYSSIANIWHVGERVLVFSQKPTSLGFDPVFGTGILTIKGEDAFGSIVYQGRVREKLGLQEIRDLIKARDRH